MPAKKMHWLKALFLNGLPSSVAFYKLLHSTQTIAHRQENAHVAQHAQLELV